MNLMARMSEINSRLNEIRSASEKETDVEKLASMSKECDSLQEERKQLESKMNIMNKTEMKPFKMEENSMNKEMLEKRGVDLKEKRTITVSSDEILLPNHVDNNLAPVPFAEVSTLVDKSTCC